SSNKISLGIFKWTKSDMDKAPIGIKILETRKSAVSNIFLPNRVKSLSTPADKADGIPSKKMNDPTIHAVFLRFLSSFFVSDATVISIIEKAEVSVANKNSIKKRMKKKVPNGIC